jgi:hypothetical protein
MGIEPFPKSTWRGNFVPGGNGLGGNGKKPAFLSKSKLAFPELKFSESLDMYFSCNSLPVKKLRAPAMAPSE